MTRGARFAYFITVASIGAIAALGAEAATGHALTRATLAFCAGVGVVAGAGASLAEGVAARRDLRRDRVKLLRRARS